MTKPEESHWFPVDAHWTACGRPVTRDTVCSPSPTCDKCREWLAADAKVLETFLADEKPAAPQWTLDTIDRDGFRLILEDEDDHHGPR